MSEIKNKIIKDHPEGMILAFTLMLLAVVSLMGMAILSSSSTELAISSHNRVGREAFNSADTSARIATLLGRILLHPELGNPQQVLTSSSRPVMPLTIDINQSRFTLANIQEEGQTGDFNYTGRYEEVLGTISTGLDPHLSFKVNDRVVSTAMISLESASPIGSGSSLSASDQYDTSGGAGLQVNLIVTVNGRPMRTNLGKVSDEPQSLLTAIYREYM
jgi:hypothetical protein